MNRLVNQRVYLAGAMDRVADRGNGVEYAFLNYDNLGFSKKYQNGAFEKNQSSNFKLLKHKITQT